MGAVPKSYVRAMEFQLQQVVLLAPAGVCLGPWQGKQVPQVGADPWWGERLGDVLGGQLPQLSC